MDRPLESLEEKFPGREIQIQQLFNLYGYEEENFVDTIYISGGQSTGKTAVVTTLLETLQIKHCLINLIECYTAKILFEAILNKLSGHRINPEKPLPYAKCDNMMDFLYNLKKCSQEVNLSRTVIVLDKAERLRNMDFNLLPGFLRFKELTEENVSVIFISELPFQKFYTKTNIVEPIKIYFPQYNKDELLEILLLDYEFALEIISNNSAENLEIDIDFYRNYLNVFLSVFYRACRDLSELRYMSRENFVKYCEPILKGECTSKDSMVLWRNIAPILKSSLEVLYLRVSATSQVAASKFAFSKENLAQSLELPFYAKYLLIAAYLASYNPAKDDKRLFMKYHGKKRKTMKDVKAKSKVSELLNTQLGPKPFSFDRLLAIFYAILDNKVGFNNNLLVQVSSLVELQLLTALSDNCNLDGQKYKCNVSFEFIQTISKMVGFNIRKYLSDFSHM